MANDLQQRKILIGVAWPYANGYQHLGHLAGAYLPPDIFARYHRLVGNDVLMVSGSDAHGTPITVRADAEGVPPREIFERYHETFLETYQQIGLTFDLFTHTDTENHHLVSQDIFLRILENGYLYKEVQQQLYSPVEGRFLPDRYVEGECPHCGSPDARGDQCDNCGKLLEPTELIHPRSKASGDTDLEARETEHYFLDLAKLSDELDHYLSDDKDHWRANVLNFARNYVRAGLRGRPITRDIDWGIPLPLPGYEGKCLYVWFEAVIGYFSASVEWAKNRGTPDAWQAWWYNPEALTYYFIGKDNIPFHTVIWPAELLAVGRLYCEDCETGLNLPYDVPANEYLNFKGGGKFSKSRGTAIDVPYFLSKYDPDALRFYLTATAPETRDTEFSWEDFVERNNNELVATWGNLANRMLSFAYKRFDGVVPEPGPLDDEDRALLEKVEAGFETVGELYNACKFRAALGEALALAREANGYLDRKAPWFQIKEDKAAAATTVYVILRVVDNLKTVLAPILPHTAQKLHEYLGYEGQLFGTQQVVEYEEETRSHAALTYDHSGAIGTWTKNELPPGQALRQPAPLFKKLDESVIEEEHARLEG
jgi:methionyl-tRNA synthetase